MSVTIIDVGAGNLHSVRKACAHVLGADAPITISQNPDDLANAERIILPGVGAFGDCMNGLAAIPGMHDALEEAVLQRATPFLGICVGMQMLFASSSEHGTHEGLGWLDGHIIALERDTLPIPHMGWNPLLQSQATHPLLADIDVGAHAYFVHSFHAAGVTEKDLLASVDYGGPVVAMVARDNIAGTQFHPEKSQQVGLQCLRNFMGWKP